jgi:hypothetical protein
MSANLAVRTRVFDELILAQIAAVDADAVLNLAAGLDARPFRYQTWFGTKQIAQRCSSAKQSCSTSAFNALL